MKTLTKNKKAEPFIESTTLWDFPTQNYGNAPHGDNKFNGVTPAFVIWNLLQRYTREGDLVVDSMCGSGTTIDVAKELGRQVIGYDISTYRKDIIKKDAGKLPLDDNFVDFVFIDTPEEGAVRLVEARAKVGQQDASLRDEAAQLEKVVKE